MKPDQQHKLTEVPPPRTHIPRVSVIICTFNAGPLLRPALKSILDQTYPSIEVFIVDDGSTDNSLEAIADLADDRVAILRQQNGGKSTALNRALEMISGDYYCLQDADDISHPHRIARQVEFLESHRDVAGVFTGYELLINDKPVAPLLADRDAVECRQIVDRFRMPGHDPTAMYRMSMVSKIRFDTDLRLGQGFDYILRVGEQHPLCVLGESLYQYRVDLGSNTRRNPELRYQCVLKLRQNAQRRRGLPVTDWQDSMPHKGTWTRRDRENNLSGHFTESVRWLRRKNHRGLAIKTAFQSLSVKLTDRRYYKPMAFALAPAFLLKKLNRTSRS